MRILQKHIVTLLCMVCAVLLASCLSTASSSSKSTASASSGSSNSENSAFREALLRELQEKMDNAKNIKTTVTPVSDTVVQLSDTQKVHYDKSYFADFEEGCVVRFDIIKTAGSSSRIHFYAPADTLLTEGQLSNGISDQFGDRAPINDGQTEYTVSASEAQALKTYGLYVGGTGVTVNKVEAVKVTVLERKKENAE